MTVTCAIAERSSSAWQLNFHWTFSWKIGLRRGHLAVEEPTQRLLRHFWPRKLSQKQKVGEPPVVKRQEAEGKVTNRQQGNTTKCLWGANINLQCCGGIQPCLGGIITFNVGPAPIHYECLCFDYAVSRLSAWRFARPTNQSHVNERSNS